MTAAEQTPCRIEEILTPGPIERELLADFALGEPAPPPAREQHYLAFLEGRPAGAAALRMATEADVALDVPPAHRRGGIGTELLRTCAEGAYRNRYSQLFGTATDGTPAAGFFTTHGFRTDSAVNRLRLHLPAALPRAKEVPGYTVREWRGIPPEDLGHAMLAAKRDSGDMPSGGLPGVLHDPAKALAMLPNRVARQGNVLHTAAAIETRTGAIVGYAELVVFIGTRRAEQLTTVVLPSHRGHGIGALLKIAMLERIARAHPEVSEVETENDTGNAPMLAINAALGFRLVSCTRRGWVYAHSLAP
ncbi:GNAT family N-acetyltransferase [Sciscionella marina]|uniref:GNAT family N-acetyltransferase n=1 Tax=Sciscionella marina TaxID=508770 RepID=UPI00037A2F89|nr:GNAT family N-acetyltransferase [Sciscionella marina]